MAATQRPDPLFMATAHMALLRPRSQGRKWAARDDGGAGFEFPSQSKGQEFQWLWTLGTVGTRNPTFM